MDLATIGLILQIAPAALNMIGGMFKKPQPSIAPMSWEEALQMAQAQMGPLLEQYDQDAISRGFYGQLPQNVHRSQYATANLINYANQLRQQQADWALKQGSLNLGQQQLGQQGMQNAAAWGSALGNAWMGQQQFDWQKLMDEATLTGTWKGQNTAPLNQYLLNQLPSEYFLRGHSPVTQTSPMGPLPRFGRSDDGFWYTR